jgi:hypothetical protein
MGETSLPFFADFIARNGGDIGPAPIVPAYRYPPAGPQPGGAPFYGPSGAASVASKGSKTSTTAAPAVPLPSWLSAYPSREILKSKLNTVGRVKIWLASVPDAGLKPYNPRAGTDMKSVWETLIRNIRAVAGPIKAPDGSPW